MLRALVAASFVATLLVACGSSESSSPESPVPSADGGAKDSGAVVADASSPSVDAGSAAADAGTPGADAGGSTTDAGASSADAGRADAGSTSTDAGPACHALTFGQPESIFIVVPSSQMGTLTGGTIVDGTYDLVAVETSTASLSSYGLRSTWRFAGNTVEQIDQLRSSSLGPVTVRTGSISVSGATISRTYTCGSTDATVASLNYDSKVVGGIQTIRVMSGGLRFTYEKR
jgi:hypothetical protein